MGLGRVERILILAKTYPSPSAQFVETSCVAGIAQSGAMRRLFPVPFRMVEDGQRLLSAQKLPQTHSDSWPIAVIRRGKRRSAATTVYSACAKRSLSRGASGPQPGAVPTTQRPNCCARPPRTCSDEP